MSKWRVALLSVACGAMLGMSAVAQAASSAKVSWAVPTTREDGKALTATELSGYEIYYTTDTNASNTIKVSGGTTTSYTVQNLAAGTYHFAVSAVDTKGLKSKLSTVVDLTVAAASNASPSAATGITTTSSSSGTGLKNIQVSWVAPTTRTDGVALPSSEISGYKINLYFFNGSSFSLSSSGSVSGGTTTTYQIANVKSGGYIVELMVVDTAGHQSGAYQMFSVP